MRWFLPIALALACASGKKQGPAAAETTVAASLPSNAAPEPTAAKPPAAPAPTGAPAAAAQSGPMTAAEAAAASRGDGGASQDAPCATADDCAFTMVAPGGCCPMLCAPRAVTKPAAEALQQHVRECAQGKGCPLPSCAPPRFQHTLACVEGRCVAQARDLRNLQ